MILTWTFVLGLIANCLAFYGFEFKQPWQVWMCGFGSGTFLSFVIYLLSQ